MECEMWWARVVKGRDGRAWKTTSWAPAVSSRCDVSLETLTCRFGLSMTTTRLLSLGCLALTALVELRLLSSFDCVLRLRLLAIAPTLYEFRSVTVRMKWSNGSDSRFFSRHLTAASRLGRPLADAAKMVSLYTANFQTISILTFFSLRSTFGRRASALAFAHDNDWEVRWRDPGMACLRTNG